jgi:hypothetical protein
LSDALKDAGLVNVDMIIISPNDENDLLQVAFIRFMWVESSNDRRIVRFVVRCVGKRQC